jgi:hypothetical protein
MGDEETRKTDPRILWLEGKTKVSLGIKSGDKKFEKGFLSDENMTKVSLRVWCAVFNFQHIVGFNLLYAFFF